MTPPVLYSLQTLLLSDIFHHIANPPAVHSVEIGKWILSAVVVDPSAVEVPEHNIVFRGAVSTVSKGRFTGIPLIEVHILTALPDQIAVYAVCADPDTIKARLIGKVDHGLQFFRTVDRDQLTAFRNSLLLCFQPTDVSADRLIAVRQRCKIDRLLFRLLCFDLRLLCLELRLALLFLSQLLLILDLLL